jgi:hypothetical protein
VSSSLLTYCLAQRNAEKSVKELFGENEILQWLRVQLEIRQQYLTSVNRFQF